MELSLLSILAQNQPASPGHVVLEIREHWSGEPVIPLGWIMIVAGLMMMILSGLSLRTWWRTRHLRPAPLRVFLQMAWEIDLSLTDQWLLYRIARNQSLPTPLTLILSRRTLHLHARAYAGSRIPWRRAAVMARVAAIRRALSGDLDPAALGLSPTP